MVWVVESLAWHWHQGVNVSCMYLISLFLFGMRCCVCAKKKKNCQAYCDNIYKWQQTCLNNIFICQTYVYIVHCIIWLCCRNSYGTFSIVLYTIWWNQSKVRQFFFCFFFSMDTIWARRWVQWTRYARPENAGWKSFCFKKQNTMQIPKWYHPVENREKS